MKSGNTSNIPPFLELCSDRTVRFVSPNGLKSAYFQTGLSFAVIFYGVQLIELLRKGSISEFTSQFELTDYVIAGVMDVFPILCLFMWLITKKTVAILDRKNKLVRFESSKTKLKIPWRQIGFNAHPLSTRAGPKVLFSMHATPPFVDVEWSKIEGLGNMKASGGKSLILGSFDVKTLEQAERFTRFFHALMESELPAESLFTQIMIE